MNHSDRFNDILSECLDRILKRETVEQCLLKYPDEAQELAPLLRTALAARVASNIQPRAEFKARARYEFQSALSEMQEKKKRGSPFFFWRWQWSTGWSAALAVIVVVVLGGGGSIVASAGSMPDNPLYSLKLMTEDVRLALTFSNAGKAELNAEYADRRAGEILYLAGSANPQDVHLAAVRLNNNLEEINDLTAAESVQLLNTPAGAALETAPAGPDEEQNRAMIVSEGEPAMALAAPAPASRQETLPPSAPEAAAADAGKGADLQHSYGLDASHAPAVADAELSDEQKLTNLIIARYETIKSLLQDALETASPEARPAIRQAIARTEVEYERAMSNIALGLHLDK